MYIGNIGELFSYCLTEGTFVLLFSDVSTLTLAPSVPLRRSQPSMKLFSSLKVMTARNEGDGNQNTHVQITPAQGCELATAGLISSDSYPNKHRKAFQNLFFFLTLTTRKRIQARLWVTTADNWVWNRHDNHDFTGVWNLRMEKGTNKDASLPPPPSGASQHPSQFGHTDALGAQRNSRHASLRETQQKDVHAQYPD